MVYFLLKMSEGLWLVAMVFTVLFLYRFPFTHCMLKVELCVQVFVWHFLLVGAVLVVMQFINSFVLFYSLG